MLKNLLCSTKTKIILFNGYISSNITGFWEEYFMGNQSIKKDEFLNTSVHNHAIVWDATFCEFNKW